MDDKLGLAMDRLSKKKREEMFLKLLAYAGPPTATYVEWCKVVESGIKHIHPSWGQVDVFDATIQYRHWCTKRGCRLRRLDNVSRAMEIVFGTLRRKQ